MIDPVPVCSGKYTFFVAEDGLLGCLRYGEAWPAFRAQGSHLSGGQLALYQDLVRARKEAAYLRGVIMATAKTGLPVHHAALSPWSRALGRIVGGEPAPEIVQDVVLEGGPSA